MKKTPAVAVAALPALSSIAVAARQAWDNVEAAARTFDRATLADRLWIGVLCLAAQEHHAMDATTRAAKGGRAKAALSRRDKAGEISPDQVHPQGFAAWRAGALPWLPQPTAYKYMDAARGAGLLPTSTEAETRQLVAGLLARHDQLSLAVLVAQGRALLPPPKEEPENWQQLTFDSLLGFRAQCESIISHAPHMTEDQHSIACARAYRVLRELTGSPWAPADAEHETYVAVLARADAGGL